MYIETPQLYLNYTLILLCNSPHLYPSEEEGPWAFVEELKAALGIGKICCVLPSA